MPATAEAEARRRGGIKAYRTVKRGNRTILVAIVPKAGPRGGHTVSMAGPTTVKAKPKLTKKRVKSKARRRRKGRQAVT
jgi:hypothetical protein